MTLKPMYKATLLNRATQENFSWDNVTDDDCNFYCHGFIVERFGFVTNVLTLPKVLWNLVEKED